MSAHDYLELAELHRKQFDTRRQVEWKITFGFWTAVGLVAYYYGSRDASLSCCEWIVVALGLVLVGVFYAGVHLPAIFGAEDKDLKFMIYFKDCAEAAACGAPLPNRPAALAEHEIRKPGLYYAWTYGNNWYMLLMMLASLGVVVAVVLFLLCRVWGDCLS